MALPVRPPYPPMEAPARRRDSVRKGMAIRAEMDWLSLPGLQRAKPDRATVEKRAVSWPLFSGADLGNDGNRG